VHALQTIRLDSMRARPAMDAAQVFAKIFSFRNFHAIQSLDPTEQGPGALLSDLLPALLFPCIRPCNAPELSVFFAETRTSHATSRFAGAHQIGAARSTSPLLNRRETGELRGARDRNLRSNSTCANALRRIVPTSRLCRSSSLPCALLRPAKTLNMATPRRWRNRAKSGFENKVGTKIETSTNFAREFVRGSGA
jgi:hypothetical protein